MLDVLKEFQHLPKFSDGRINYSSSNKAPVINCFIMFDNKILLLKRSDKVSNYRGKWNVVAGYIDENCDLRKKVLEEVEEELRIKENNVLELKEGKHFELYDSSIQKTWLIFPFLTKLKNKPDIFLDWEHTEFKWVEPDKIKDYEIIFGLDESLKKIL